MTPVVETEDGVPPATARQLRIIALAMGSGLTLMAGFVAWAYLGAAAKVPTAQGVKFINALTVVAMVAALLAIVVSEVLWRSLLRRSSGTLGVRAQGAFIVRLACREFAGLLGMTVAYLAALNGVLRVYPAYAVNLAPYALFLGFLATHWPSDEKLAAEVLAVIGEEPLFNKEN